MKVKHIEIEEHDVNTILQTIMGEWFLKKVLKIDEKLVEEYPELSPLLGFEVVMKTVGDHKNDGQLVEYTFTFKSPSSKKTIIKTDMCLMVGFNVVGNCIFKS